MRDDDLFEVELSPAPSVPLRGVRTAVVAPLVAIALASAGCGVEVIGVTIDAGADAPAIVNDAGLYYDAGRVDAPGDAPRIEEDAPAEDVDVDAGPPPDVG